MDEINHDPGDGEHELLARRLRHERPQLTGPALDQLKQSTLARLDAPRRNPKGARILKSRIAITLVLLVGLMSTGTGATLAVTGPTGDGAASSSQYDAPGSGSLDEPGGSGAEDEQAAGQADDQGEDEGGTEGVQKEDSPGGGPSDADADEVKGDAQEQAVADSASELPFTGGPVLGLLVAGLALLAVGGVLGLRARSQTD